jgi:hypothetical protein
MEANVNFLLPLADWLFGTMRRDLTTEELARHGSLAEAKAHPRGTSEPAREVARPRDYRALLDPQLQQTAAACLVPRDVTILEAAGAAELGVRRGGG